MEKLLMMYKSCNISEAGARAKFTVYKVTHGLLICVNLCDLK